MPHVALRRQARTRALTIRSAPHSAAKLKASPSSSCVAPAAPRHRRHVLELRDGEVGVRARIVRAHELGHARSDLGAEARAVENAVVADLGTLEVHLVLGRNAGAQIERGAALAGAGDVVLLAFDRHQRRPADGAEIDGPAARGHEPARHQVLHEHGVDGLQVELGREIHHGQVFVVEFAVLVGRVAVAAAPDAGTCPSAPACAGRGSWS